jgi:hypothetical protein
MPERVAMPHGVLQRAPMTSSASGFIRNAANELVNVARPLACAEENL